jgi:hypothetical protein
LNIGHHAANAASDIRERIASQARIPTPRPETFAPGMLEAQTIENYQLETAMWIGATLEQGVWYEISAPLSL